MMQYKIVNLRVKNFKCFDNAKFYEFCIDYEKNPIILSGPNGFGKTTFFDAIELIFSKNITRLNTAIENKKTNLGKNILLNKANVDGYVVLTLKRQENEFLTLFAKISNNNKLEIENSICYGDIKKFISTEDLDSFLCNYDNWKDAVDNKTSIKYRAENFNVYYYVSQAESVHFLKRTISDRKNAMNVLLKTDFIDERKSVVTDLIGSRNGTSGYVVNDEIITLENELKNKAIKLKTLSNNIVQDEIEKPQYVDLGLYKKDPNLYFWDKENIAEANLSEIKRGVNILDSIISFWENESDYRNYKWNKDISKILKGNSIGDYADNREYIIDNLISIQTVEQQLEKWDSMIQIYNSTLMFRQGTPDAANYKDEDVVALKKLIPDLKEYDFSLIKNISSEIVSLRNTLSTNQKIIDKLSSARNALKNVKNEYDEQGTACPFTDSNLNHTGIYLYSKGKIMIHLTFDYKTDEKCTTPGQYLKYHRTFQGLSTRELAEKVGIVPATLVLYENDRHPIKHSTAVALANALGIDRNRLLDKYTAFVDYPYSSLLKKVRQDLSLTQIQMAELIGIGQTSYSGWEREIRVPRRKEYDKILAALEKLRVNVDTYLCQSASI